MEGYFPIEQYCRITGCSKDTAHHRVIRGTVESFRNSNGRYFLYYNDEVDPVPEGFVHYVEYAKIHNINQDSVRRTVKNGLFNEGDIKRIRYMTPQGAHHIQVYIRSDAEYPNTQLRINRRTTEKVMNELRPEGYLTVKEFAEREGMTIAYLYNRIYGGWITGAKQVEGHWYIPEKTTFKMRRKRA
jgi:hypothetical protein